MKEFFDKELLAEHFEMFQEWVLVELPAIIGLIIGLLILLKTVKFAIKRLKKTLLKHAEKNDKVDTQEAEKRITTLMGIVWGVIKIILIAMVFMIILQKLGINIAPILASAGIIGLAVGFGAQELVRDVISGFFIILDNQIRIGDSVIINGTEGIVENIALRTLNLRDIAGVVHVFQNGKIDTLSNRTKEWSAAVFNIGVAYKEDIQRVMDVMKKVGEQLNLDDEFKDKIIEPLEIMGLNTFGDSALVIRARIKTKPSMQWIIKREFNKLLKVAFDNENIEIPFPHSTIYWGEKTSPLKLELNNLQHQKQ